MGKKTRPRSTAIEHALKQTLRQTLTAIAKGERPESDEHAFPPRIERELEKLRRTVAESELNASQHTFALRTQLAAIARDLAGHAASLARKGRPRLLAVLAKIAQEQNRKR
ncbi:MAG TPA: hypothetical protein VMJ93_14650 [Verrucomicrobiae bacterium]|nr:hypothetical protein [Verrucomicrobiae bacterium]